MIFATGGGKVFATDAKTGHELWSAAAPGESVRLAFQDARLLAVNNAGTVACFAP